MKVPSLKTPRVFKEKARAIEDTLLLIQYSKNRLYWIFTVLMWIPFIFTVIASSALFQGWFTSYDVRLKNSKQMSFRYGLLGMEVGDNSFFYFSMERYIGSDATVLQSLGIVGIALCVVSVLICAACGLILPIAKVKRIRPSPRSVLMSMIASFLVGFLLFSVLVEMLIVKFVARVVVKYSSTVQEMEINYDYAFILTWISFLVSFASGIGFFFARRQEKLQVKQRQEGTGQELLTVTTKAVDGSEDPSSSDSISVGSNDNYGGPTGENMFRIVTEGSDSLNFSIDDEVEEGGKTRDGESHRHHKR